MTYLHPHPKNGGYWFKRGIPLRLRTLIGRGTTWYENLHTKDESIARLRAIEVAGRVEAIFQQAEQRRADQGPQVLTVATLQALVAGWRDRELYERAQRVLDNPNGSMTAFEAECRLAAGDDEEAHIEAVWDIVNRITTKAGVLLTAKEPAYNVLSQMVADTWPEILRREREWREFDYSDLPANAPEPMTVSTVIPKPKLSKLGATKLMTVHALYARQAGLSPSGLRAQATTFRLLREVVGGDVAIGTLSKDDIVTFKSLISQMPKVLSASDRKLPLPDLIKAFEGKQVERVSLTTLAKHMQLLHAFTRWAHAHNYTTENIAAGLIPPKSKIKAASQKRLSYSPTDIHTLFTSPIFTGCASAARTRQPGNFLVRDERYWLPILALHQGCRLEELGQLKRSDVREENGIWYLDVTTISEEGEGHQKRLKTDSSHRMVPLHPTVIALGFLDYVRRHSGQIFPNLKPNREGRLTQAYSKKFARYCDAIGMKDKRKVFHSFRHTFKDTCRKAKLGEEIHDALTGHAKDSEGRNYGSFGIDLENRADAMNRLQFAGFPLPRILVSG
ncbi:site-specific integrase [Microvirga massiliensis]|uniref:site-specific integrase n=1 Tax=Microvirga massiliensis TaxID=1033741 RepID=UPI00062BC6E3|nr:site-specific integrase [Microvirga massiliensis]